MQRRTFVSCLLLLGGGLAGHSLTKLAGNRPEITLDTQVFATATMGVNLKGISSGLLLKLVSRQVSDHDRHSFVKEVVRHNRSLFIIEADSKRYGVPGFYRVTE